MLLGEWNALEIKHGPVRLHIEVMELVKVVFIVNSVILHALLCTSQLTGDKSPSAVNQPSEDHVVDIVSSDVHISDTKRVLFAWF